MVASFGGLANSKKVKLPWSFHILVFQFQIRKENPSLIHSRAYFDLIHIGNCRRRQARCRRKWNLERHTALQWQSCPHFRKNLGTISLSNPLKKPCSALDYVHAEIRRGDFVTPSLLYDVASEGHEKIVPAIFVFFLKGDKDFWGISAEVVSMWKEGRQEDRVLELKYSVEIEHRIKLILFASSLGSLMHTYKVKRKQCLLKVMDLKSLMMGKMFFDTDINLCNVGYKIICAC